MYRVEGGKNGTSQGPGWKIRVTLERRKGMKTLQLVFNAGSNATSTMTIANPKDGLTLDEVKTAAAKIQAVLVSRSGADITGFKKAVIVTTSEEELA